jgi:hypothetical protein
MGQNTYACHDTRVASSQTQRFESDASVEVGQLVTEYGEVGGECVQGERAPQAGREANGDGESNLVAPVARDTILGGLVWSRHVLNNPTDTTHNTTHKDSKTFSALIVLQQADVHFVPNGQRPIPRVEMNSHLVMVAQSIIRLEANCARAV